jgi:hypothetical protein
MMQARLVSLQELRSASGEELSMLGIIERFE